MLSDGKITTSDVNSIIPKGKVWSRQKHKDLPYETDEERLFNEAFTMNVEGTRRRATAVIFTKADLHKSIGTLINQNTILVNSFLRRIISPRAPFFGHKNGKCAVTTLTQKFRNELKATLSEGKPGYKLLTEGEAYAVTCYFVATGPDSSTFEGTTNLELRWYAESLRDGKGHKRPIVHVFSSGVKV